VVPQEYGSASDHPFTTSRVDLAGNTPSKSYPYRAAGKIYFNDGVDTFVCSGALIKKGLIVTAAHCVAEFGQNRFYSGWQYIPALSGKKKPYGTWLVTTAWVPASYLDGTASCSDPPVVCENDIAILVVKPKGKVYPGKMTGWFGYGWDGFGFTPTGLTLVNQLGYPTSHDNGLLMQRTDSQGFVSAVDSFNTVWGSRQTGGSSGGPELVNLGMASVLGEGVLPGVDADGNTVIGVTSWGYTDDVTKEQGASPFTSGNIPTLIDSACAAAPAACAP
jgi:V8-like Glu-specific endopeptidase